MNAFKFGTIVQTHDLDYERLWNSLNRTDRSIIMQLTRNTNPLQNRSIAASTTFSALKRLQKKRNHHTPIIYIYGGRSVFLLLAHERQKRSMTTQILN